MVSERGRGGGVGGGINLLLSGAGRCGLQLVEILKNQPTTKFSIYNSYKLTFENFHQKGPWGGRGRVPTRVVLAGRVGMILSEEDRVKLWDEVTELQSKMLRAVDVVRMSATHVATHAATHGATHFSTLQRTSQMFARPPRINGLGLLQHTLQHTATRSAAHRKTRDMSLRDLVDEMQRVVYVLRMLPHALEHTATRFIHCTLLM